jgi:hypothetical protein
MDRIETYPFQFRGGLVTNLSPLQQGVQAPGTARILKNFEPSVQGGYRRIEGYTKYDSSFVPSFGEPKVQGSGQTGTTLFVANLSLEPSEGDTFTIAGNATVYTIDTGGVSYSSANKTATLTIVPALAVSPSDKANISFVQNTGLINGVAAWDGVVVVARNNNIYKTTGSGYTKINKPSYGTVLVNGGSQTGTTLVVDGLSAVPQIGDTFSIAGVEKVYTVLAIPSVTSGGASLSISPSLASSPADNAAITWLSTGYASTGKLRFTKYRIGTSERIAGVGGSSYPFKYDGTTFTQLTGVPDIIGANHIAWFKNQLFLAKGDSVIFTAPFTDNDFNPANGSGVINVGSAVTAMIVFREQLIIFSEQRISRLVGNTLADFVLQPITLNIGCVAEDTVQEIGGDVMFLGPDGLRLLSATDRIGDFNLAVASKSIQKELTTLISVSGSFSSVVVRKKSQYRLLGYSELVNAESAVGVLGTQLMGEDGATIGWAETVGIRSYVADSDYYGMDEVVVFAHNDGYVYKMESGNDFDGRTIIATFSTPYVPINDPRVRKTFYKLFLYTDPRGSVTTNVNLKLDFDDLGSIQPDTITLSNTAGTIGFYGDPASRYGITVFGTKLKRVFESQLVGSGFSASLQFVSDSSVPPFSLDAATIEYATHDRR